MDKNIILNYAKEHGFEKMIVSSFEDAKNNSSRKNIVLTDDAVYLTFKHNTPEEQNVFGELVSWVEDEFEEDETVYEAVFNAMLELFLIPSIVWDKNINFGDAPYIWEAY